ncbi:cyanophycinase [Pararhizobium mangrovi]|uniref:Cyanophycinase n=2 Tax=Pararhizobium mangrovi TaxID=2590452 RepID=A0A506TZB7_9HYPH|nr:cyanophycinase [Pararhizobium mangrovi]
MEKPESGAGRLVAIGGAEDKTSELAILRRVLSLAPDGNSTVGVLATASGIPDEIFPVYREAFDRLGASEMVAIDVRTREDAFDEEAIDTVRRCGTIFFTGGDQLRLTSVLGGTPLLDAIRHGQRNGVVIAGTSAGAAAMSATMISTGRAADALRKGAVKMSNGLAFVDGVVIDSHFLERGRFTRLMEVGASNPEYIGIGLGEDSGVIFHPDGVIEAIGSGHVIVVDCLHMKSTNVADLNDGEPVAVENVVMHALTSGLCFDIAKRAYITE